MQSKNRKASALLAVLIATSLLLTNCSSPSIDKVFFGHPANTEDELIESIGKLSNEAIIAEMIQIESEYSDADSLAYHAGVLASRLETVSWELLLDTVGNGQSASNVNVVVIQLMRSKTRQDGMPDEVFERLTALARDPATANELKSAIILALPTGSTTNDEFAWEALNSPDESTAYWSLKQLVVYSPQVAHEIALELISRKVGGLRLYAVLEIESTRFRRNPDLPKDEKDSFVELCANAVSPNDFATTRAACDALGDMRYKEGMWRLIGLSIADFPEDKTVGNDFKRNAIAGNFPLLLDILDANPTVSDVRNIVECLRIYPIDIVAERLTAYLSAHPEIAAEIGPVSFPETVPHDPHSFDF